MFNEPKRRPHRSTGFSPRLRFLSALASLALVAACVDEPTTPTQLLLGGQAAFERRPEEALFVELHARAPSSAGFFADSMGAVHVVLTDRSEEGAARRLIGEFAGAGRFQTAASRRRAVDVRVRQGRFNFAQLAQARDRLFREAPRRIEGVVSLDLDEVRNRVVLGILPDRLESARTQLEMTLREIGVDPAMVIAERGERVVLDVAPPSRMSVPGTLISEADPLVAGVEIVGPKGGCTLGAVVDRNGVRGFVSASHCSSSTMFTDYSSMTQGGRYVGQEDADPEPWSCDWFGECRGSDANFYMLVSGIASERGLIARPINNQGSLDVDQNDPYFIVQEEMVTQVTGDVVHKVGRTTGWSTGVITGTCVDQTAGSWPNEFHIVCMGQATYNSEGGDSGAPVFKRRDGNLVTLMGIHHGRYVHDINKRMYSAALRVQGGGDLGEMIMSRGATLATPVLSGYVYAGTPVVQWSAVPGATKYHLYRTWWRYNTGEGDSDPVYLGEVTSPFNDYLAVTAYTGGTQPGPHTPGFVRYYLVAEGTAAYSPSSSHRYFRLAP